MSSQLSETCQKIVSSETFKNYDSGKRLLTYLCEQSLLGQIPKETTIGVNLFDTDRSQEMDTAKVRVYVHNLRRKLLQYYRTEGKNEPVELVIPVGSYKAELKNRKKTGTTNVLFRPYTVAILILILGSVMFQYLWKPEPDTSPDLPDAFFGELIRSDKPVLVVLGDMFIFKETNKITGEIQTIRNHSINSNADFMDYVNAKVDSIFSYEDMTYTFLVGSSSDWVKELTQLFHSYDKEFSIRVNSRVQVQDLHDYNIIFAGLQKTAGIFNNYFEKSSFTFREGSGYRHKVGMDTVAYISHGNPDALHTDYGFIAKYQGPRNNLIYMFGGLWDTSVSQALKLLIDPKVAHQTAHQIESKFGSIPKQFEILLEVDGMDRTDLNAEIIMINEVTN